MVSFRVWINTYGNKLLNISIFIKHLINNGYLFFQWMVYRLKYIAIKSESICRSDYLLPRNIRLINLIEIQVDFKILIYQFEFHTTVFLIFLLNKRYLLTSLHCYFLRY